MRIGCRGKQFQKTYLCMYVYIYVSCIYVLRCTAPISGSQYCACGRADGNTLQHTATHCNTLQLTATHCNVLQHTVTIVRVDEQIATYCSALQRAATHCNKCACGRADGYTLEHTATRCNTLQHTVTHCNTHKKKLQLTATDCNDCALTSRWQCVRGSSRGKSWARYGRRVITRVCCWSSSWKRHTGG